MLDPVVRALLQQRFFHRGRLELSLAADIGRPLMKACRRLILVCGGRLASVLATRELVNRLTTLNG